MKKIKAFLQIYIVLTAHLTVVWEVHMASLPCRICNKDILDFIWNNSYLIRYAILYIIYAILYIIYKSPPSKVTIHCGMFESLLSPWKFCENLNTFLTLSFLSVFWCNIICLKDKWTKNLSSLTKARFKMTWKDLKTLWWFLRPVPKNRYDGK